MNLSNAITTIDNTRIMNSCLIKSKQAMRDYLTKVRKTAASEMAVSQRDIESQVREWRAHNFFYCIHVFRSRTKDVDLERKQAWWREWFCRIVDFIYFWDN